MPQTIEQLRTFQWGREGTRGTAVAATSKMAVTDVQFAPLDSVYRPKLKKGLLHRNPGSETVITRGTKFTIPETPVIYDQIQNFLLSSIKGAVTPSGGNPYTWAIARLLTADPNPDTVGQVLRAEVTYHTGLKPKMTLDGRTDLDFTAYVFDASVCGIDAEFTVMAGAQYAIEKTAAEAQTIRAVRLSVLGTSSRELTLDMLVKHVPGSSFELGADDGQDTFKMQMVDTDDATNMLQAKVVNAVSTLL